MNRYNLTIIIAMWAVPWGGLLALPLAAKEPLQAEQADITGAEPKKEKSSNAPNLNFWTFGGKQFWSDELVYKEWRIQRNVFSKHCRLLDGNNLRRAWGDYDHCRKKFEKYKRKKNLPAMKKKVVIALHGLCRSRASLDEISEFIEEDGQYEVLQVSYASTRAELSDHSKSLARVIENLEGVEEINFVAHSLGNLVIRRYLSDHTDPEKGLRPDPRIHRIVMLAPPNNGSQMAVKFRDNKLFRMIWGNSGIELAEDWETLEKKLATPEGEFGIIAGGKKDDSGSNPTLEGDDDFVVSVEETKLPGARDFIITPTKHSSMMKDEKVQEYALRFLREGFFISKKKRNPLRRIFSVQFLDAP